MTIWREDHADVLGTTLSFSRHGDGLRGLVMLHGQLGVRGVVQSLVEAVPDRSVLVPDLRGRGRSVCREIGAHSWTQYVDDVERLLDHAQLDSAVLAGVSLGAGLAIATALRHSSRVEALVTWASPYRGESNGWSGAQREVQAPILDKANRLLDEGSGAAVSPDDPGADSSAPRWDRHDRRSIAAALVGIGWSQPFAHLEDLAAIGVPSLVIPGNDALHAPEIASEYVRVLPNGRLGHAGSDAIPEFIASLPRETTPAT